jgi:diguanylate cyclase (GGDEF)-like protein
MTFKDAVSDRAWRTLRYRGVDDDMRGLFRDPWVAVCSAIIPAVRAHVVRAEQNRRIAEDEGRVDCLSGLYNRRAFDEDLQRELWTAFRHTRHLALTLFDIDDFGIINKISGQHEGDKAITRAGNSIGTPKSSDKSYRLGGDEFAIIMPETEVDGARRAAEYCRDRINNAMRCYGSTVSIGIAEYTPHINPRYARYAHGSEDTYIRPDMSMVANSLYDRAGKALLEAKKTKEQKDRSGICIFVNGSLVEI